ncbi:hypothetical protein PENTCL1PPCAC_27567, partial [Pristionchus entomophagus]
FLLCLRKEAESVSNLPRWMAEQVPFYPAATIAAALSNPLIIMLNTASRSILSAHLEFPDVDSADLHFSRACLACLTESPRHRAVFTACGHA